MKHAVILLAASLFSAGSWASCYTVLGPKGEVLQESTNPPVDMSYPLHQTVPERFGEGAVLVFGIADGNCGAALDPYDDTGLKRVSAPAGGIQPAASSMRPARRDRG